MSACERCTMTVIDVDAHFEPAADWLDEFPSLQAEMPELLPDTDPRFRMDSGEMFAYFVSDDLLRGVPREQRMPIEQLTTAGDDVHVRPRPPRGRRAIAGASQYQPMADPSRASRGWTSGGSPTRTSSAAPATRSPVRSPIPRSGTAPSKPSTRG